MSVVCEYCKSDFLRNLSHYNEAKKENRKQYCSKQCKYKNSIKKINKNCKLCEKIILVPNAEIKKNRTGNFFCSRSCSATYNNMHKTKGIRTSKIELYLQNKLKENYPNLDFHFNQKNTINSELDIYIPLLRLAFEINGIFHYKPIYGEKKFLQIKNNDLKKIKACLNSNIELFILDISSVGKFNEKTTFPFFEIIKNKIDVKLK